MKKTNAVRKHGYAARAELIERRLRLQYEISPMHETCQARPRLTTQVTFESQRQSYLWTTDRGRSRLIKH